MNNTNNKLNAYTVIEQFGGTRPLAKKLDIPFTTVQGWKKRNSIPDQYIKKIEKLAKDAGIDLSDNALAAPHLVETVKAPLAASAATEKPSASAPVQEKIIVKGYSLGQGILVTGISVGLSVALLAVLFGPDFIVSNPNDRIAALESKIAATAPAGNSDLAATQLQLQDTINNRVMPRLNEMQAMMGSLGDPQSLADLSANIKNLQQSSEGQATLNAAMIELQTIVAGLKGEVDNLDGAMVQAQQQNGALAETLGKVSTTDLTAAAMLLALNQFRSSLDRQEPLSNDITLLKSVINPDENPELVESIDRLEPFAASGVMSSEGLSNELGGLANAIVEARLKGDNAPWQDIAKARLQQIFDVRKDGVPVLGTQEQKLVAEAQKQLNAGDVAGAKMTLEKLPVASRAVADPVIQKADQNLMARNVESEITRFFARSLQGLRSGAAGAVYNAPVPYTPLPVTGVAPMPVTPPTPPAVTSQPAKPLAATPVKPAAPEAFAPPVTAPAQPDVNLPLDQTEATLDQPEGAQPSAATPSL